MRRVSFATDGRDPARCCGPVTAAEIGSPRNPAAVAD